MKRIDILLSNWVFGLWLHVDYEGWNDVHVSFATIPFTLINKNHFELVWRDIIDP